MPMENRVTQNNFHNMFEEKSGFTITVKFRDYKCTPARMELIADEWMGKSMEFAKGADEADFIFTRKDWAEEFQMAIESLKR